jgi:hypothetical protein
LPILSQPRHFFPRTSSHPSQVLSPSNRPGGQPGDAPKDQQRPRFASPQSASELLGARASSLDTVFQSQIFTFSVRSASRPVAQPGFRLILGGRCWSSPLSSAREANSSFPVLFSKMRHLQSGIVQVTAQLPMFTTRNPLSFLSISIARHGTCCDQLNDRHGGCTLEAGV